MNTNTELLEFTGMIALRVTLVLMLAGVVSLLLRRSSAALRHWVWVLAMCAALLMPAFVMIAPRWNVELPTKPSTTDAPYRDTSKGTSVNPFMRPTVNPLLLATNNQTDADPQVTTISHSSGATITPTLAAQSNTDKQPDTRIVWPNFATLLLTVWAIGAFGILWMGIRHYGKFRRVTTHTYALEVPHDITELAAEIRQTLAIRRPVRLMMTPAISIPMTIGVVRPIILLPADAVTWDAKRRRVVLLHESIHIARWDALLGWLSLFVVALHWFNPLAWIATRRLAIESENACDDRVLQLGTTGPDYAAHLVAIAQNFLGSLRHKSLVTPGLAQMTQIGNLPSRVHAILDKQRRRSASRWQKALGLLLVLSLITPVATIAGGQNTPMTQPNRAYADDAITLTVGLPEDFLNSFNRAGLSLDEFEAAHPGVKVVLRRDDSGWLENAVPSDPEAYLNDMTDFADTADVVFIWTNEYLNPIATRAGMFLDLAPAIAADPDDYSDRYFPAAWASYQWDGGTWALPTMLDPVFVSYNRPAFDAAGLTYPDENWTMDQYVTAAHTLTTTSDNGVTTPGLSGDPTFLFQALLGRPLDNMLTLGDSTSFAWDTDLLALAEAWVALAMEGAASIVPSYEMVSPLQIGGSWALQGDYRNANDDGDWSAALLPNGVGGLVNVPGFAVSAGTTAPELAYELAKHLSLINTYLDNTPIAAMSAVLDKGGNPSFYFGKPEAQKAADLMAAENAMPLANRTMSGFLVQALFTSTQNGGDLVTALGEMSSRATEALVLAENLRPNLVLSIPPEAPPVEVPPGQVALQFHLLNNADSVRNMEQWERAAVEFAEAEPDVFSVDLLTGYNVQEGQQVDCYVSDAALFDLPPLDLAPLMAADPAFDADNFAPGIWDATRFNDQTAAYPLAIQPELMWVDTFFMQQAGVNLPTGDWDITTFEEAIRAVKDQGLADSGMTTSFNERLYLMMLIAAHGGLPIDYRKTPATIDLTNQQNLDAMQHVLDLVKQGYIEDDTDGVPSSGDAPIRVQNPYGLDYLLLEPVTDATGVPYRPMLYPTGQDFTPIAYRVTSGYVSTTTQNAEACYRWLRFVAQQPGLVIGVPAQKSVLDSPSTEAFYGATVAQTWRDFYTRLESPNTLIIPIYWASNAQVETAAGVWINEAFTAYLNENADLVTVMTQAQDRINSYMACIAGIPELTESSAEGDWQAYFDAMLDCAVGADPDIMSKEPFNYMYGSN